MLCAAGEVLWVGVSPLGEHDGRIALYLSDDLWLLHAPPLSPPAGELQGRLREYLARHGASFFAELRGLGEGLARPVQDALWDLVFAGEVINDTPGALRAFLGSRPSRSADRLRRRSASSAHAAMRRQAWLDALASSSHPAATRPRRRPCARPPAPSSSWRVTACSPAMPSPRKSRRAASALSSGAPRARRVGPRAPRLLRDRSRRLPVRPSGRARSLAGLARGGVGRRRADGVVLASTDPANPYGAALPWPKGDTARPCCGVDPRGGGRWSARRLPGPGRARSAHVPARRRADAGPHRPRSVPRPRHLGRAHRPFGARLEHGRWRSPRPRPPGAFPDRRRFRAVRSRLSLRGAPGRCVPGSPDR